MATSKRRRSRRSVGSVLPPPARLRRDRRTRRYDNLVEKTTTPGTKLHDEWDGLAAPGIAKAYWKLHDDAKWVDCLQHMLADESHHRDVNHTFATLPEGAPNPFIKQHMQDFDKAATAHAVKKLNQ